MMKFSEKRRAGGFTLAEVVIALTIIIIVTGSALTLIASHTRLEQKSLQTIEAAEIAENVIESFRWWKNNEATNPDFDSILGSIGITEDTEAGENRYIYTVKDDNNNNLRIYKLIIGISDEGNGGIAVHITTPMGETVAQDYTKHD